MGDAVEVGDEPIASRRGHLAGDLGVTSLVRLEETVAAELGEKNGGDGDQQNGAATRAGCRFDPGGSGGIEAPPVKPADAEHVERGRQRKTERP